MTLTAKDTFGNNATGYTGTAHFTKSDTGVSSIVPADYAFTAADKGLHAFTSGVTFVTAGSQTVTATDTTSSSITGNAIVAVSPAAAKTLTVTAPTTVFAGIAFTATVAAKDSFGNIATGYTGKVHFTSSDTGTGVAVPADYLLRRPVRPGSARTFSRAELPWLRSAAKR